MLHHELSSTEVRKDGKKIEKERELRRDTGNGGNRMERVYERCCGINVHKKLIVVCLRTGKQKEIREFGACTRELLLLADWLQEQCCRPVHSQLDSTVILIRACGYARRVLGNRRNIVGFVHVHHLALLGDGKKEIYILSSRFWNTISV